jgi:hypothetical protein
MRSQERVLSAIEAWGSDYGVRYTKSEWHVVHFPTGYELPVQEVLEGAAITNLTAKQLFITEIMLLGVGRVIGGVLVRAVPCENKPNKKAECEETGIPK